jgi:hypothetical protein
MKSRDAFSGMLFAVVPIVLPPRHSHSARSKVGENQFGIELLSLLYRYVKCWATHATMMVDGDHAPCCWSFRCPVDFGSLTRYP